MIMHRTLRMAGRDPHETHRTATTLELLFDLTFVVAFSIAGNEFAHLVAEGHFGSSLAAFGLAMFGVCWAWINFSWFASAYDTDDWLYRVLTMVQMVGVVVFSLGIPDMFKSVDAGGVIEGRVIVAGYVIMRLALVAQWLRVARHDSKRSSTARTYAFTLLVAQVVWIVLTFGLSLSAPAFFAAAILPFAIELSGPYLAEQKGGTPWHPHHIAERYGLLAIIALGEGVVGTVASVSAFIKASGWNLEALVLAAAGIGLTFSMWWIYFALPFGSFLHHHRERAFFWGYGHMVLFAAIAATGAGLHVAGYFIEHKSHISSTLSLLSVVLPVAIFIASVFVIYDRLAGKLEPSHIWQLLAALVFALTAVLLSLAGLPLVYCLLVLVLSPASIVVGYEWFGHHHIATHLEASNGHR